MDYTFVFDSKDIQALKKLLEENSMDENSFARLGYTLKEGKNAGLQEGKYYLHFKTENTELANSLSEKLKAIPSFAKASEADAAQLKKKMQEEEESATEGFGSIFG
ncbi:hypothetical protein HUU53_04805 [Candidatus Micrarchaeota archaeon]|nr:hypothetical protein [Candidatus Micrarchaeota archaeon]